MKQSSIEWLVENLTMVYPRIQEMRLLVDKAKAMHKKEIKEAFSIHYTGTADEYYEETFNTKSND